MVFKSTANFAPRLHNSIISRNKLDSRKLFTFIPTFPIFCTATLSTQIAMAVFHLYVVTLQTSNTEVTVL